MLNGPIPAREVKISLTPETFIALFREFSVKLTHGGLQIDRHGYNLIDN